MWGHIVDGRLEALCHAGANLVPVQAGSDAVRAFADRGRRQGRRCASIVGDRAAVGAAVGASWRPPGDRPARCATRQPLMAISAPAAIPVDPLVRRVRPDELDILLPACVAMFTEEVGVSPVGPDGGASYRSRVAELVRAGRAFARIEGGRVVFKAEIGSVTPAACQVQGVWVAARPARPRAVGAGDGGGGRDRAAARSRRSSASTSTASTTPARATYRAGRFTDVGTFMSVLF